MGIRMTVTAVTVFVIFMAVYVNFLDKEFMENLDTARIWGSTMSTEQAVIGILIEGVVSGVIMTFIMMQFFKGYIHPRDDA